MVSISPPQPASGRQTPVPCAQQDPQMDRLTSLRANGYLILERLAPADLIDRVSQELEPWFDITPRCKGDFYGWNTTRLGSVLLKSPSSHELLLEPTILGLAEAILAPHCDWVQLNLTQATRIHPGERQQAPHRDEEMWPCAKNGAEYLINVLWALTDFTIENGATLLWQGSQFQPLQRQIDAANATIAQMPRGSALVYLGSVTHCAGANRSTSDRTGLIFSYCLGWLKQYENAFLSYPPDVARNFPKPVRDLLGYRIHRPNLGCYEGQDPAVLFETNSHALAATDAIPEGIATELSKFYGDTA